MFHAARSGMFICGSGFRGAGSPSRGHFRGLTLELIGDRALQDVCTDRGRCNRRGKALADLHDREHAAHLDRPELAGARHHRQRVVGHRHFHVRPSPCRSIPSPWRRERACRRPREIAFRNADEVLHVVTHRIHRVVGLVAMKRPVARIVGDESRTRGSRRPARRSSSPAIVRSPEPSRRPCTTPKSGARAGGSDGWSW